MFSGFPPVYLAGNAAPIDLEHERTSAEGCVNATALPSARSVRLSFPALCHLLSIAKAATSRRSIFGRICGLQLGSVVDITDVRENPLKDQHRDPRETPEERARRLEREKAETERAFSELNDMYTEEELDTYQVGHFVVCNSTYNPYSNTMMNQLMELYDASQPMVLLTFDPFRTSLLGRPYIRAFVPTDEYVKYHDLMKTKKKEVKPSRMVRECNVARGGVLREVTLELDVDAYHRLGLLAIDIPRRVDNFQAIQADAMSDYVEALVNSVRANTESLTSSLDAESKANAKEANGNVPLAQRIDTLLALQHLREQTLHLEAICDSLLLNSSVLRDL